MTVSIQAPSQMEKVAVKKIEFARPTYEMIQAYAEAFKAEHGSEISIEVLIPLLVDFAFEKDPKFKKYLKENTGVAQRSAA